MEATAEGIKEHWGRTLQAKREERGETQVQLAARLDLFPTTISRAERGQGSMETFVAMANALAVDLVGNK